MKTKCMVLLVLSALSLSASAQVDSGAAAAIRALEREWTVAQSHNDNRALDKIFDNALVYVEYGRLVTKGEYLSKVKSNSPNLNQIQMEPMTVHVFGGTAIVVGSYLEKQIGSRRHEVKRWRFIDTWVYKKDGWVLVAAGAAPVSN